MLACVAHYSGPIFPISRGHDPAVIQLGMPWNVGDHNWGQTHHYFTFLSSAKNKLYNYYINACYRSNCSLIIHIVWLWLHITLSFLMRVYDTNFYSLGLITSITEKTYEWHVMCGSKIGEKWESHQKRERSSLVMMMCSECLISIHDKPALYSDYNFFWLWENDK